MSSKIIADLKLEDILDEDTKLQLQSALKIFSKVRDILNKLSDDEDGSVLRYVKISTVLTFSIVNKLVSHTDGSPITEEEWKEIASEVVDKAILLDGQSYSILVFRTYADYIEVSAKKLSANADKKDLEQIKSLAKEIRDKSKALEQGKLEEVSYTEDCLWLALEAMTRLLTVYIKSFTGSEVGQLIQAVASYGFEYYRLALFRQEHALLTAYLENQKILDDQLKQRFEEYKALLMAEEEEFQKLIDNAFSSDTDNVLINSAELAKAAGTDEANILESVDDVDDFFLN